MPSATDQPLSRRALLDAASGPLHPRARDTLLAAVDAGWADPRRLHAEARTARRLLDTAREVLSSGLGVRPSEVSFTSGGEEGVRVALEGLTHPRRRRGARVVASAVEHSSVLENIRYAAAAADRPDLAGIVAVDATGAVDLAAWSESVGREGTVLAALQHANGEVGTLQPLTEAAAACREHGIPLLVDARSSLGRVPAPESYDVLVGEALSFAGPGGLGLLVVPERTRFGRPGPHREAEHGRTDAAPWVPLALAAAEAWQQVAAEREQEASAAHALVAQVRAAAAGIPDVEVAGAPEARLPHVVTFSVLYVDGETLVHELDRRGFAVASGSACTASTLEPSHVLRAMGFLTHGNVRVTLPLATVAPHRDTDVARFCAELPDAVAAVRAQLGVTDL